MYSTTVTINYLYFQALESNPINVHIARILKEGIQYTLDVKYCLIIVLPSTRCSLQSTTVFSTELVTQILNNRISSRKEDKQTKFY